MTVSPISQDYDDYHIGSVFQSFYTYVFWVQIRACTFSLIRPVLTSHLHIMPDSTAITISSCIMSPAEFPLVIEVSYPKLANRKQNVAM